MNSIKNMKSLVIGASNNHCNNCGKRLYWKSHKEITKKMSQQAYYFSKWEYCINGCKSVWFKDEFKVWNRNEKAQMVKDYEEIKQKDNFIRNL